MTGRDCCLGLKRTIKVTRRFASVSEALWKMSRVGADAAI
jgi:hypothetical protein